MTDIKKALEKQKKKNFLIIISGPTCSGKDSVMRGLLKKDKRFKRLITTNSRAKRPDEIEGVDYYFIARDEFEKLIAKDAFYEWVEYRGEYRGTQKKHVLETLKSGKDIIWRIDVRGVKNVYKKVKKEIPNSIFIFLAESLETLEKRMKSRHAEDKKWMKWNLSRAVWELKQHQDFDYLVFNQQGQLKTTIDLAEKIVEAEKCKVIKKNG